jgi:predicted metalloprotease with PDZ domain
METKTVSFRVSADAARAYESASSEQKRKLEALVSSRLRQATRRSSNEKSLKNLMSEMSRKAQERGLTPEKLDNILNGR